MRKILSKQFSLRTLLLLSIASGALLGIYLNQPSADLVEFTDQNFDERIESDKRQVLVLFRADWCAPCQDLPPVLEELAYDCRWKTKVGILDIDKNPKTSARFGVQAVPTFVLLRDGKLILEVAGTQTKEELAKLLDL